MDQFLHDHPPLLSLQEVPCYQDYLGDLALLPLLRGQEGPLFLAVQLHQVGQALQPFLQAQGNPCHQGYLCLLFHPDNETKKKGIKQQ